MSDEAAMRKPGWWPVRRSKAKQLADEAEAARDKTYREVAEPLRRMRQSDFMIPAIVADIEKQRRYGGG